MNSGSSFAMNIQDSQASDSQLHKTLFQTAGALPFDHVVERPTVFERDLDTLSSFPPRCSESIGILVELEGPSPGRHYEISWSGLTLGRGHSNHIALPHASVSREHALIYRDGDSVKILDQRSRNGTFVNERPISEVRLEDGDRIEIGALRFCYLSTR